MSDVAGRGDAPGTPLPARPAASCHVDPTWFSLTRADVASTRANSPRLGPESAGIGRYRPESAGIGRNSRFRPKFKKKKKNPERTVY